MPSIHQVSRSTLVWACAMVASFLGTANTVYCDHIANIWISNEDNGPEAAEIYVLAGTTAEFNIWGRPESGLTLNAFALNVDSSNTSAVSFQSIEVHNPVVETAANPGDPDTYRHQLVFDSDDGVSVDPDFIDGFIGLTVHEGTTEFQDGEGIGPSCDPDDTTYCSSASGSDSWHLATVTYDAGTSGTSSDIYLEISTLGITHVSTGSSDFPSNTSVVFGATDDVVHEWSAGTDTDPDDDRNSHSGLADAVIYVVDDLPNADFDSDTVVDGEDFVIWQRGFGLTSQVDNSNGDADFDGTVDGTDLDFWRDQFGDTVTLAAAATQIPEPASPLLVFPLGFVLLYLFRRRQRHCHASATRI